MGGNRGRDPAKTNSRSRNNNAASRARALAGCLHEAHPAAAHALRLLEVVRDPHARRAAAEHELLDQERRLEVECARRLVEQQHLRPRQARGMLRVRDRVKVRVRVGSKRAVPTRDPGRLRLGLANEPAPNYQCGSDSAEPSSHLPSPPGPAM